MQWEVLTPQLKLRSSTMRQDGGSEQGLGPGDGGSEQGLGSWRRWDRAGAGVLETVGQSRGWGPGRDLEATHLRQEHHLSRDVAFH